MEGLRYYLRPKACFLAIKVRALKGKDEVLHPLHVVYRSAEARIPLKFFANAGTFDVYAYALVGRDADADRKGLAAAGFSGTGRRMLDSALRARLGVRGLPGDSLLLRYEAKNVNAPGNPLSAWREDPRMLSAPQRPR